jgi:hypothetical protein
MAVLRDRDSDAPGSATQFEDGPAGAARQRTEPLDVRTALERRDVEVV